MSPDPAGVFARAIDGSVRRARALAAAESAAVGAAVAAGSIRAGLVVALACAAWRSRAASRRAIVRALEEAAPQSRNLLVTADELATGTLTVKPFIRDRVFADAAPIVELVRPSRLFPVRRVAIFMALALGAWSAAALVPAWRDRVRGDARQATSRPAATGEQAPAALQVTATVEPPAYTGAPSTTVENPTELRAIENSTVRLFIRAPGARLQIDSSGSTRALTEQTGGRFEYRATLLKSGYLALATDEGSRRVIPVTVIPDALPVVRVLKPARDLVYAGGNARIAFDVQATDDFGVRSLALRFTKVSGSGEQFEFTDGEIPLALTRNEARDWKGVATRTLAELGLADGDLLVYRAVATDARPGGAESSSDAFFIEISKLGASAGDAFTLPEQETRYALSQQMLIVKTERLHQRRGAMDEAALVEASQGLAVEQRMIRSEFVFMLGGEVEDEEIEAAQSTELQEGRLANRGQRDLRAATIAMSQAEKLLTGADTGEALKAERAAVEALQRAFARDRYILRAMASRSQLDASRRLTGSLAQAVAWRRALAEAPVNKRAALLQSLLMGLGEIAALSSNNEAADALNRIAVLAELAVRIDAEAPGVKNDRGAEAPGVNLRRAAADLQRLADQWRAATPESRAAALERIVRPIEAETRRALADPPAQVGSAR